MLTKHEYRGTTENLLFSVVSVNHGSTVFAEVKVALGFFLLFLVYFVVATSFWTLHLFFTFLS